MMQRMVQIRIGKPAKDRRLKEKKTLKENRTSREESKGRESKPRSVNLGWGIYYPSLPLFCYDDGRQCQDHPSTVNEEVVERQDNFRDSIRLRTQECK